MYDSCRIYKVDYIDELEMDLNIDYTFKLLSLILDTTHKFNIETWVLRWSECRG